MKVYIGPYYHWFQPAKWFKNWVLWCHGLSPKQPWHVLEATRHKPLEAIDAIEDWVANLWVYKVLQKIEWWCDSWPRKVSIRVDNYDVWNLGDTLAMIALPMMYEFKRQGIQGSPHVDDADVPEYLRSTAAPPLDENEKNCGGVDKFHHQRWVWVVDEIIWALEQVNDQDADSHFFVREKSDYGPSDLVDEKGYFKSNITSFDKEGYAAFNARKERGLTLLGKYLEAIWN